MQPPPEAPFGGGSRLVAPAAVRIVDLEAPLTDLVLPTGRLGKPYRSALLVPRLGGDPLGTITVPVGAAGFVPRDRLARALYAVPWRPAAGRPERPYDCEEPSRPSISVVVPTCGDPEPLERCLRSVLACDYDDFEVIVVDNRPESTAAAVMIFEQFADDPRLRYVEESRPGASWARNAGLALADGEVVAFADDDVVVDSAWLRRCAAALGRADDVGCVTGLILPLELETEDQVVFEQFAGFAKGFESAIFRLDDSEHGASLLPYTPGSTGSGANCAVRANLLRRLGGFDTTLGPVTPTHGAEDLDLFVRILRGGHGIAYEPAAMVFHEHPQGRHRLRRQAFRYGVGLGALLGKNLVRGPDRLGLVRAVPAGLRHASDRASRKNAGKGSRYPRRLDWLERAGMLVGPFAYVESALATAVERARRPGPRDADTGEAPAERLPLAGGRAVKLVSFRPDEARPARPASRPRAASYGPAEQLVLAMAIAACVAAPLLVAIEAPAALRFPAVLALICLAPGSALLSRLGARLEAGLLIGTSIAGTALVGQIALWLGAWHPTAMLYGLAAVCLVPLASAFEPGAGPAGWLAGISARVAEFASRVGREALAHLAVVSAALLAWAISLAGADLAAVDGLGLVSAMPPIYFLALALLLGGFATAVARPRVPCALVGLYVVALILVIHGTTPLLYDEPRYVWTFKHLGVIDFIAGNGAADREVDVYNNWPAFFALNAWLSEAGGVRPGSYAEWAQVFFNLANVVALRFALRGLTSDERLVWIATWLFVLANFIGQDYLAPQALGFLLSLVALGACLRCSPSARAGRGRARLGGPRGAIPGALLPRGVALTTAALCGSVVVLTHQLSPLFLVPGVLAIALVSRRAPLWLPLGLALMEVWWVWLAWPFLTRHFDLFNPNPIQSARPEGGDGLSGLDLVTYATWASVVLIVVLAGIGLVRRLRAGHRDVPAIALLISPLLAVGVQSYGGEGRVRVLLFILPWLCFFAAAACSSPLAGNRALRNASPRLLTVSAAACACLLFAYFGSEYINRIPADDVTAAVWFERHAPRRSTLASAVANFPYRLTGRYPVVYANSVSLADRGWYRGRRLDPTDMARLKHELRGLRRPRYVVMSPGQQRYARLYGLLPRGALRRLNGALHRSRAFRLVYRRGGASIYKDVRPRRTGLADDLSPRRALARAQRGGLSP